LLLGAFGASQRQSSPVDVSSPSCPAGEGERAAVPGTQPPAMPLSALGICPGSWGILCDVKWGQREGASLARRVVARRRGAPVPCRCWWSPGGSLRGRALTCVSAPGTWTDLLR